jgi:hypothetical protein
MPLAVKNLFNRPQTAGHAVKKRGGHRGDVRPWTEAVTSVKVRRASTVYIPQFEYRIFWFDDASIASRPIGRVPSCLTPTYFAH